MPATYRSYGVWEIAIGMEDKVPHAANERAWQGDIIAVRRPSRGLGLKEMTRFLWMHVQGLDDNEMTLLTEPVPGFAKRRCSVPLARLGAIAPGFDPLKAADLGLVYQPFLGVDAETGLLLAADRPYPVEGLIFDKLRMEFF
jgi:hypothetical protein